MKATMSLNIERLAHDEVVYLKKLGLSDHEIQVYEVIRSCTVLVTAQMVASKLMIYPNAVYRIFRELERRSLITQVRKRPVAYRAIEVSGAYGLAYQQEVSALKHLLERAEGRDLHHTTTLITGREELYKEYIRYAQKAEHEIGVFAIGIAYSKELQDVQTAAIKKGVYIRHVVQRVQPTNYHIIHKWQRLGVKLRYLKEEQGYHVVVIDREVALVTFSNKDNTEDRLTLVTRNITAVKLFQAQFESVWASAGDIPQP